MSRTMKDTKIGFNKHLTFVNSPTFKSLKRKNSNPQAAGVRGVSWPGKAQSSPVSPGKHCYRVGGIVVVVVVVEVVVLGVVRDRGEREKERDSSEREPPSNTAAAAAVVVITVIVVVIIIIVIVIVVAIFVSVFVFIVHRRATAVEAVRRRRTLDAKAATSVPATERRFARCLRHAPGRGLPGNQRLPVRRGDLPPAAYVKGRERNARVRSREESNGCTRARERAR
ncbi:hypothetical protein P5V15_004540 [Pogonomyrmex californicus]